jgi:alkanesulfonate monooxygenase SsuD/methylene tetrahydromethanopterin reductase-like flavin-dependent oxidoreductase (luciferase family)
VAPVHRKADLLDQQMRLGLTLTSGSTSALDDAIERAVAAEQAGFHTIYLSEGHFRGGAGFANAYALAAAVSGQVQQAWLGVCPVVGLDHPLRLVEQSNLLDVLTRGRCLIVISDELDPGQYEAFGLPTPRNGLLDHLVERMLDAWSWRYQDDAEPLEFQSGVYATRMAGRIMPGPWRQARPLLACESAVEDTVIDAARRGWPIQLRGLDTERVPALIARYRETLTSADHSESTVEECLRWLVVAVELTSLKVDLTSLIRNLERSGVAELRLDPPPGLDVEELTATLKPDTARSA